MSKNIDKYIKSMHEEIDSVQIFSNEELRSLIDSKSSATGKKPETGKSIISKLGGLKMGILATLLTGTIIAVFMLVPVVDDGVNDTDTEGKIPIHQNNMKNDTDSTTTGNEHEIKTDDDITKLPVLYLTDEQMKVFGIDHSDKGLTFIHDVKYEAEKDENGLLKIMLEKEGYKGIKDGQFYQTKFIISVSKNRKKEIARSDGRDMNKPSGILPVASSIYSYSANSKYLSSTLYDDLPIYDSRITEAELGLDYVTIENTQNKKTNRPKFVDLEGKQFYLRQMVPVHFKNEFEDGWAEGYIWFLPNEQFLSKLPKDKAKLVKKYCLQRDFISYNQEYENEVKSKERLSIFEEIKKANLSNPLQLNDDQARKIGINFDGEFIAVQQNIVRDLTNYKESWKKHYSDLDYPTNGQVVYKDKEYFGADSVGFIVKEKNGMRYNGWENDSNQTIIPIIIKFKIEKVYYDAKYDLYVPKCRKQIITKGYYRTEVVEKYPPETLIPISYEVEFIKDNDPKKTNKYSIEIWYLPTKGLIDKLPENEAARIRRELKLIEDIDNDAIMPSEACQELEEESVLGICQMTSENIPNVKVYPNPMNDKGNIRIEVNSSCKVTVAIYKMTGNLDKIVIEGKSYNKGTHYLNFDMSKSSKGVYMVVVTTDKGDQVTRKIYKE